MALFEFKLPDIGEGVVEGEIVRWLIKEGDEVAEDQPMVEVMTDKATVTIPSPKRGRVTQRHGKEGEIAKVHGVLVSLEVAGEGAPAAAPKTAEAHKPAAGEAARAAAPVPALAENGSRAGKVLATPVTRRIAREHGLNLAQVPGSGPSGRVTKADVMALVQGGTGATATGNVVPSAPRPAPVVPSAADERIPLRGLRRRIAEKMVKSKQSAPHFVFVEEMDATELVRLRARINQQLEAQGERRKMSYLPIILKAIVAAMKKHPNINAIFDEAAQELVVRKTFNFGIAVASDEGLTVPVVKGVESLSLRELSVEIERLSTAVRERRIKAEELSGGTFTITSLGQQGGLFATPIINNPEVAILGVHKMRERPVVVDGQVVVRTMMYLSGSFDHRFIDGAVGAAFIYELIRYLEHPELLLLEMS